jgi:outer membrane biosynthesis protein TonB
MNRFEIIFTAVMATIILHLTIAVIFMSVKISALKREMAAEIILSVDQELPDPAEQKAIELSKSGQFNGASFDDMVNVIKNLADKPVDIDPKEYEKMVRDELIKSGMISEKNYPDEQAEDKTGTDEIPVPADQEKPSLTEKKEKPEEKGTFRGPTRIFYDLAGRHHVYLPIPIYKCEGAGQLTLTIEVDRNGNVIKAEPASSLSSTKDPCLTETAVEYALKSKFNSDQSAPVRQAGFLTFVFVAQ